MRDALIIDAVRTPIGKRNGTLASVRADELAAQVLNGLVERIGIDPGEIEDVQMGCVTQVGEQALNVGADRRRSSPGWPETVCATTVDRQCGSSMQAAFNAAAAIQAGHLDVVVAAGVESMSRVPMGSNLGEAGWSGLLGRSSSSSWQIVPQGISAEVIAEEWDLSREALDEYSLRVAPCARSRAIDEGRFEREIVPIEARPDGGVLVRGRRDAAPRHVAREAGVAAAGVQGGRRRHRRQLEPIVDGAAAMLVASEERASRLGLEPRARFVSFGLAGVDPYRMLHGNPQACERALATRRPLAGTTSR